MQVLRLDLVGHDLQNVRWALTASVVAHGYMVGGQMWPTVQLSAAAVVLPLLHSQLLY